MSNFTRFFRNGKTQIQKYTHTQWFCFSTPYYCTANPPTDHS